MDAAKLREYLQTLGDDETVMIGDILRAFHQTVEENPCILDLIADYCGDGKSEHCSLEQMQSDLDREADASAAYSELIEASTKLYFWGYRLDKALKSGFFGRISEYIQVVTRMPDVYTPVIATSLIMLAMHDHPEARIVEAVHEDEGGTPFIVRWVEFCHHGNWYVVEPIAPVGPELNPACYWLQGSIIHELCKLEVISHEDFWSSLIAKRLYYELREAKMSRLWAELLQPVWDESETARTLEESLSFQTDPDYEQKYVLPGMLPAIIDQHIVNLMMRDQGPTRADILREYGLT